MNHIEILAPAGSFDTMKAAYKAGADAVYIGGTMFGARAYADNADADEMLQAIDYAHLHGRQLYLTVNTLLKNNEIEKKLAAYLKPYYEHGLDAVIVQDLGVLQWIRAHFPELPVHASTQMTICGAEYAKWLGDLGVTRVVTPRELNLQEIAAIKQRTGLEIETFVHGALCYCYSGQCLMSSMIGGRSGNRGRCAQPCRLPYSFDADHGKVSGHLLSPKDLCGLEQLPDLLEAGVDSLKIEGRMKKPEYAALTTAIYRKYVDLYLEKGRSGYRVEREDMEQLMDLYNRGGFTDGYFKRHNGKEMMSVSRPNHSGLAVGTARMQGKGDLLIQADHDLHTGDVLELPDQSSVKIGRNIPAGGQLRQKYTGKPLKKACRIMRTRNESLIQSVTESFVKNHELKEKIYGSVSILKDLPAKITLDNGAYHVALEGAVVQAAQNRPLTEEDVRRRLMKTGGTPFDFERLDVQVGSDCYVNIQDLNQLRRDALRQMEEMVLQPYRRCMPECVPDDGAGDQFSPEGFSVPKLSVMVSTPEQLKEALAVKEVEKIYLNDEGNDRSILDAAAQIHAAGKQLYLAMPYILRASAAASYENRKEILEPSAADGFLVRNFETIQMLRKMGMTQPCTADYNLYCMNDNANNAYLQLADSTTLPLELNRKELASIGHRADSEMIVYGYMPVMVSAQCLVKTTGKCTGVPSMHVLEDRFHKHFPVKNVCGFCYNLIYNTVPLHLLEAVASDMGAIHPKTIRLQFLNEPAQKTAEILKAYTRALSGEIPKEPVLKEFTRGHYQRGIE